MSTQLWLPQASVSDMCLAQILRLCFGTGLWPILRLCFGHGSGTGLWPVLNTAQAQPSAKPGPAFCGDLVKIACSPSG